MASREVLPHLLTGMLVICAVAITGLAIRREIAPASSNLGRPPVRQVHEWASFADGGHRTGPSNPAVKIVEFSDFQCPFCRVLASLRLAPATLQSKRGSHISALPARRAPICTGRCKGQ
jgi:hypothetical protein